MTILFRFWLFTFSFSFLINLVLRPQGCSLWVKAGPRTASWLCKGRFQTESCASRSRERTREKLWWPWLTKAVTPRSMWPSCWPLLASACPPQPWATVIISWSKKQSSLPKNKVGIVYNWKYCRNLIHFTVSFSKQHIHMQAPRLNSKRM